MNRPTPSRELLTEKEAAFVKHMASGIPKTKAAKLAGFADHMAEPSRLLRRPHVALALDRAFAHHMRAEVRPLAVGRLKRLLADDKTTGRTLIDAIRLGLGNLDALDREEDPGMRSLAAMSVEELEGQLARLQAALVSYDAKTIDQTPADASVVTNEDVFG